MQSDLITSLLLQIIPGCLPASVVLEGHSRYHQRGEPSASFSGFSCPSRAQQRFGMASPTPMTPRWCPASCLLSSSTLPLRSTPTTRRSSIGQARTRPRQSGLRCRLGMQGQRAWQKQSVVCGKPATEPHFDSANATQALANLEFPTGACSSQKQSLRSRLSSGRPARQGRS
jgi:hypothetical protein